MMNRRKLLLLLPAAAAAARAEDPWKAKPLNEWDEKEIDRVLTKSPWAHTASVSMEMPSMPGGGGMGGGRRGGGGGGGGGMGGGGGAPSGGGAPGGGGMGGDMGGDMGGAPRYQPPPILVRWESAGPLRILNLKNGNEGTPKLIQEFYIFSATGFMVPPQRPDAKPGESAQFIGRMKQGLQMTTKLTPKDRPPMKPTRVELGQSKKGIVAIFFFSREEPIPADAKEVKFDTAMGPMKVSTKFKLKDMTFDGKLDL